MALHYAVNQSVYNTLCGLAYRIADNAYMIERYGVDDSAVERAENHKTIVGLFEKLDSSGVPFWVQNDVIAFGENWRRYKTDCLARWLSGRGCDVSGVSCL